MCDNPDLVNFRRSPRKDDVTLSGFGTFIQSDIHRPCKTSILEMEMTMGLAVFIQNLYASYESGKPILRNLSMTVKQGSIYTMLGDSGCGKSTLLNTIVGLKRSDYGNVFVLNKLVNGVLGNSVGYMPQDTALYDHLSITENLRYHGRLNSMSEGEIEEQSQWLIKFLKLPPTFQLVKNLSGGMRRRCSLAVALIHRPKLIILDEPTAGLDPLLRESIWKHFHKMVQTGKQTIIVTTHYLEETKYADTIGIMRKGRLIAEDVPQILLQQYKSQLLQEVVLKLCREDETNFAASNDFILTPNKGDCATFIKEIKYLQMGNNSMWKGDCLNSVNRIKAFSTVIWLTLLRHPILLGIILFLPTTQMLLSLLVIGADPSGLKFGVVNHDSSKCSGKDQDRYAPVERQLSTSICDMSNLSCQLIEQLSNSTILNLISVETETQAIAKVMAGEHWGYFHFPSNYSVHLENLFMQNIFADNETLHGSRVSLRLDMSNYLGATMAVKAAFNAFTDFRKNTAMSCFLDPYEVLTPWQYRASIFDENLSTYPTHRDYVIPVILLTVMFEVPTFVSSILLISDRKQGTMDRARAAGLTFKEIMTSHVITQGSVIIAQLAIRTVIMSYGFNLTIKGSLVLYFFILFLGGMFGTSVGIFLGVLLVEEIEAILVIISIFFLMLTYGVPASHVPHFSKYPDVLFGRLKECFTLPDSLQDMFPFTLIIESLRSVIYRGVGMFHSLVWPGIAVIVSWLFILLLLSLIVTSLKKKF